MSSRVNGQSHDTSDLDIVLRNPNQLDESIDGYMDLKEALQESAIAISVDVHDWAHLPAADLKRRHRFDDLHLE